MVDELNDYVQLKRQIWINEVTADFYDPRVGKYATEKDTEIIFEFLKGEDYGLLLDMPCGSGRFTSFFLQKGFDVVSADYAPTMVEMTKSRYKNDKNLRSDAFRLPFKTNSFDYVICLRLVFHYPNYEQLVKELVRVTKKEGIIIFDSLNRYSSRHFFGFFFDLIRGQALKKVTFSSPSKIRSLVDTLNLKLEDHKTKYVLPTRSYNFLPANFSKFFDSLERICPKVCRVVSYWKLRKV